MIVVVKAVERVLIVVNTLAVTVERAKVIVVVVLETTVTTVGLMVVLRYWLQKWDAFDFTVGASNPRRQSSLIHVAVIGYGGPATTTGAIAIAERPKMILKTLEANMLTIRSLVIMVAGLEETG